MPTLGSHLKNLRERNGTTQRNIALKLSNYRGIHQGVLSKWELDMLLPDAGQLEVLLDALEATPEDREMARTLAKVATLRPDIQSIAA